MSPTRYAVEERVAAILSDRGNIDILVNNAGVSRDGLIGRMKEGDWNDVLRNQFGRIFSSLQGGNQEYDSEEKRADH